MVLTALEISITIWAALQISKGATFHQLNSLHLKYNGEFGDILRAVTPSSSLPVQDIRKTIINIRNQPVACLEEVNFLDTFIMRRIGTAFALDLCRKDIRDADRALEALTRYESNDIKRNQLINHLISALEAFRDNSTRFERPITQTVTFTLASMIPIVLGISLFNIVFITFISRDISSSLQYVIRLLNEPQSQNSLDSVLSIANGEIGELLVAAKKRVRSEIFAGELNQLLEKEVSSRTQSLTRANNELTQFAYRASHDLKGPLTTSLSLLKLAKLDITSGKQDEGLRLQGRVEFQLKKLEQLVVDILDLARADLDEPHREPVDISACVDDTVRQFQAEIDEAGIYFSTRIGVTQPLEIHRVRITQILQNLISNAIKYHDSTQLPPSVTVFADVQNNVLSIAVEDNGKGIPEKHQNQVFERFKRFHTDIPGSGLGLAIVQRHATAMEGSVRCQSTTGHTRFTVEIPLKATGHPPRESTMVSRGESMHSPNSQ